MGSCLLFFLSSFSNSSWAFISIPFLSYSAKKPKILYIKKYIVGWLLYCAAWFHLHCLEAHDQFLICSNKIVQCSISMGIYSCLVHILLYYCMGRGHTWITCHPKTNSRRSTWPAHWLISFLCFISPTLKCSPSHYSCCRRMNAQRLTQHHAAQSQKVVSIRGKLVCDIMVLWRIQQKELDHLVGAWAKEVQWTIWSNKTMQEDDERNFSYMAVVTFIILILVSMCHHCTHWFVDGIVAEERDTTFFHCPRMALFRSSAKRNSPRFLWGRVGTG